MNWLFALPLEVRLGMVFTLGLVLGTQVNRGIYRLAWNKRNIGPWSKPDKNAPPRQWCDFLPVIGWFTLRRESKIHGAGYWLRPATIELTLAGGLMLLYWWEVQSGLVPPGVTALPDQWIHAQFLAHAALITLMTTASFIDVDEKTIPPEITELGAMLGLVLAAALPFCHLPAWNPNNLGATWNDDGLLFIASPNRPPGWFAGPYGLLLGVACLGGWWLAILPMRWITRFGFVKAIQFNLAGIRRAIWPHGGHYFQLIYLAMLAGGLILIIGVWLAQATIAPWHWQSLLSSLIGMIAGGGIVWGVRIVGTHALKMEAMGFGDVTLVAMIGAYLGWQPCLMLFFIAPFIGVVIAVVNLLLRGEIEIWYGPFLCLGALIVIVGWATFWGNYGPLFEVYFPLRDHSIPLVPALVFVMFALMWAMLIIWRFIKIKLIFGEGD